MSQVKEFEIEVDGVHVNDKVYSYDEVYIKVKDVKITFGVEPIEINVGMWTNALKDKLEESGIESPIMKSIKIYIDSDEADLIHKTST